MNKSIKDALREMRCELRPAAIRTSYDIARDVHNGGTNFARIAGEPLKDTGKREELALVGVSGRLVCFIERASCGALREPLRAWFAGYTFVECEPDGCVLVRIDRGVYAGCTVRYPAHEVREAQS